MNVNDFGPHLPDGRSLMAAAACMPWLLLMLDGAWPLAVLMLGWVGVDVAITISTFSW